MPATDNRILPLASVRLYDVGQGDPVITDSGWRWLDILSESAAAGTVSLSSGELTLQYLPDAGLVCRPFLTLADTRATQYSTSGGSWEERRPDVGSPRKYRMVQYDTTANVAWSATAKFSLPANPSVGF